jgi:RND family efflux transporter MFP subunit
MREAFFLLAMIGPALLAGCGSDGARASVAERPPTVAATVITVAPEPFRAALPITGTLVSTSRVDVKAEVAGRITRFDKDEGARVSAGEPIAWVNDENYQLSLRQAQTVVAVAEAGVERAQLLDSHSRAELERATRLLESGGITDQDLKSAQLAERDARAQVALATAQLDQARAALDVARKRVRDTVIHSPVAGEIQSKLVNAGAYVESATPLFTVVDNSRLELESFVATADLAALAPGQRVVFAVSSYPGAHFEGRVIDIAAAIDEQTRSAKIRVRVANPGGKLKTGMFVEGEVVTGVNSQAIVIPASAVYRDDRSAKSSYVFVVENGKAARRDVRIGHERDSKLEIIAGLQPGDCLIAEQNIEIAEGVSVEGRR